MNKPVRLVASAILSMSILAGARANAQVNQNGPYYATPSWDQQIPTAQRFIVLSNWGNAAVLDRETGLVWEKVPTSNVSPWRFYLSACFYRSTGGRLGWRMPSIEEFFDADGSGNLHIGGGRPLRPFEPKWEFPRSDFLDHDD